MSDGQPSDGGREHQDESCYDDDPALLDECHLVLLAVRDWLDYAYVNDQPMHPKTHRNLAEKVEAVLGRLAAKPEPCNCMLAAEGRACDCPR